MADERPKCLVSITEEEAKNYKPATDEEIEAAFEKGRRARAVFLGHAEADDRCFNGNHPRDENGVCLIDGGKC